MDVYTLYALTYAGVVIPAEQYDVNPGCQQFLNADKRNIAPIVGGLQSARPVVSFSTPALASVLGLFGQSLPIAVGQYVSLYFTNRATGNPVYGDDVRIIRVYEGAVHLKGLSAQQGGLGMASYEVYCTWDGANSPIAFETGAAPSVSILDAVWTLGPANVYTENVQTQSVNWDTGFDVMHIGQPGKPFPLVAGISGIRQTVTIDTLALCQVIDAAGPTGRVIDNLEIFFRKISRSTGRVAEATSQHISVSFAQAHIVAGPISGQRNSNTRQRLICKPIYNQANPLAVIDTAAPIAFS